LLYRIATVDLQQFQNAVEVTPIYASLEITQEDIETSKNLTSEVMTTICLEKKI
jgi:hypothetical protein